jgi:hypothetical protein
MFHQKQKKMEQNADPLLYSYTCGEEYNIYQNHW